MFWACSGPTVTGTVTDGLTGQPMGGFELVATARGAQSSPSCQQTVATVAADGTFTLNLCGGTPYDVKPKGDVFLPQLEADGIPDGGPPGPLALTGYLAPTGDGLYLVTDGKLKLLSTNTGIARDVLPDDRPLLYPSTNLKSPPKVTQALLLTGAEADRPLVPLVPHADRIPLKSGALPPADVVGLRVGPESVEEVTATPDPSLVLEVNEAGRHLLYLKAGALPAGRYVAFAPNDPRAVVLEF